jgi:hypothetical protein
VPVWDLDAHRLAVCVQYLAQLGDLVPSTPVVESQPVRHRQVRRGGDHSLVGVFVAETRPEQVPDQADGALSPLGDDEVVHQRGPSSAAAAASKRAIARRTAANVAGNSSGCVPVAFVARVN